MSPDALERMLREVAAGNLPVDRALERLAHFPGETIDDATVDHQRTARCGFPEVIYGLHKTPEMVLGIAERLVAAGSTLLATRLHEEAGEALAARFPDGTWHRRARVRKLQDS